MMKNIITTNVRLNPEDMIMAKEMAGELGLSFNGYINWLIKDVIRKKITTGDVAEPRKRKMLLVNMAREARKIKDMPDSGFSEDDKIIYGF